RRLAAVHRAWLRDRLLVGAERGARAREPDLPAALVRVRTLRAAEPAPGVHPEPGAVPAELSLRAARVERARRRPGAARREPRVARRLHRAVPGARRPVVPPGRAREVRVGAASSPSARVRSSMARAALTSGAFRSPSPPPP